MMHHNLKIWPEFFEQVKSGYKRFEIRKMDRMEMFTRGDTITLKEWNPNRKGYTGREISGKITHVVILIDVPDFEPPSFSGHGFCVFGFDVNMESGNISDRRAEKENAEAVNRWKEFFVACCAAMAVNGDLTAEMTVKMGAQCADLMQKEFYSRFDGKEILS